MCGIWGAIGVWASKDAIESVSHRGPDGCHWREIDDMPQPVTLGHRRLAVFDLSGSARQPMTDASGRYQIVFNGAIYNHIELRQKLGRLGHTFRTHSDTEVLLKVWIEWGIDGLKELNGMFAFVVWDGEERTMTAVRDRYGVKPLYWARIEGGIAFASEPRQFLAAGMSSRANVARVVDFLATGIRDHTDETMFDGIHRVPAGCYMRAKLSDVEVTVEPPRAWYCLEEAIDVDAYRDATAEDFFEVFSDAVKIRMRGDREYGFSLSGGLDSSSICAMAHHTNAARFKTFSISFDDPAIDETPYINAVVAACNPNSYMTNIEEGSASALLERTVDAQGEPFVSCSMVMQNLLYGHMAENGIRISIDGQGADEVLAGYDTAGAAYARERLRRADLRTLFASGHGSVCARIRAAMSVAAAVLPAGARRELSRRRASRLISGTALAARAPFVYPVHDTLRGMTFDQVTQTVLPALLHVQDRNSMSYGIESRMPFMDYRIVEMCLSLSSRKLFENGKSKAILRHAMRNHLPERIVARRDKIGFSAPDEKLMRVSLRAPIETGLRQAAARFAPLIEPAAEIENPNMERLLAKYGTGSVFRLASLGMWGQRFDVE